MTSYKVVGFNQSTGQLIIEFAVGMSPISVDVPIKNGVFISGDELNQYIQGFIPVEFLERQAQLSAGVPNVSELFSLVEEQEDVQLPSVLTEEQEKALENQKMWEDIAFEKRVAAALVKFGLLEADPTTIKVSSL